VLQFDKLHDSVCEDNSWIDGKFWQSFFVKHSQTFFKVFFTFLPFLTFFYFYLNVYYVYALTDVLLQFWSSRSRLPCRTWRRVRCYSAAVPYQRGTPSLRLYYYYFLSFVFCSNRPTFRSYSRLGRVPKGEPLGFAAAGFYRPGGMPFPSPKPIYTVIL